MSLSAAVLASVRPRQGGEKWKTDVFPVVAGRRSWRGCPVLPVFTADLAHSLEQGFSSSALLAWGAGPFFVVGACPVHCLAIALASAH